MCQRTKRKEQRQRKMADHPCEPCAPPLKRPDRGAICHHSTYTKLVIFIVIVGCVPCGMAVYWEVTCLFIWYPHLSNAMTFLCAVTIGSLLAAMLMPNMGRRRPLLYGSLCAFPAIILNALYQGHHALDLLIRIFSGLGIGTVVTTSIVYLGELPLPYIRGRHYALLAFGYWFGAILYCLLYRLDPWFSLAMLFFPIVFFLLGLVYMPASPTYVLSIGHQNFAEEVLYFLRCGCKQCQDAELLQLHRFIFDSSCVPYGWGMLDRCLTVLLMCIFTHFTGFLAFVLCTRNFEIYITYPVIGIPSILGFICYYIMITRISRSWVMFISFFGTLLSNLIMTTFFAIGQMSLLLYIMLPLFFFCYFLGAAEMFLLMAGEVFPYKTKHFFVSFAVVVYFMAMVLSGFITREFYLALGPFLMSLYFAVQNFFAFLYAAFVVPGYQKENFVQVQEYFDGEEVPRSNT